MACLCVCVVHKLRVADTREEKDCHQSLHTRATGSRKECRWEGVITIKSKNVKSVTEGV